MKRLISLLLAVLLCAGVCLQGVLASPEDADFDGIENTYDAQPDNNGFSGTLTASRNNCKVSYRFDYRWFFGDPAQYNAELCTTSLVLSSMVYAQGYFVYDSPVPYSGGTAKSVSDAVAFLKLHGFQNLVDYTYDEYVDDDVSELAIGHHRVTFDGETKHIIAVDVRGTGGFLTEWSSNFDMGDRTKFNTTSDWLHYDNHKGFDVAATRALKRIRQYLDAYTRRGDDLVFWVTGHSRGAAIANILAADLIDEGETVFGYTFATPNTTVRDSALGSTYASIFNLVNQCDFVPCVPLETWGFQRYGRTALLQMTKDKQDEWCTATDNSYYSEMSVSTLSTLLNKLSEVAPGWDDCYVYHCACHGDGTMDDITVDNLSQDEVFTNFSDRARQYCKVTSYTNSHGKTRYKVCQMPAFFMQALADVMGSEGFEMVTTIAGYSLADHYKTARNQILLAAAAGIADPHMSETYYILSLHTQGSDFAAPAASACPHSYAVYSTLTPATCSKDGLAVYRCSLCGDKVKQTVGTPGHNYISVSVTPATCIEQGYTKYTCTRCSASVFKDYTALADHTWTDTMILTPATETSTGLLRHTCSVCHITQTEVIPVHVHDYIAQLLPPTCLDDGGMLYTCACGDSYIESFWELKKDG